MIWVLINLMTASVNVVFAVVNQDWLHGVMAVLCALLSGVCFDRWLAKQALAQARLKAKDAKPLGDVFAHPKAW